MAVRTRPLRFPRRQVPRVRRIRVRSSASRRTQQRPPPGWIALTGTPGTGKSSASRLLPYDEPIEVRDLALRLGAGKRTGRHHVEVDLTRLISSFRRHRSAHPAGLVVGHLAHLLPVQYTIVLRCHPLELRARLRRARRPARAIRENLLAEALDVVLVEALGRGTPVYEIDTTRRRPSEVARLVGRVIVRRPAARYGEVRWLADPRVTEQLLRGRV